jgi:voltage-gated potassium channel Kch
MTKQANWRAWLRYQFDRSMSAGTAALIGWLGLISMAVIAVAAFIITLTRVAPEGSEPLSFGEAAWESLMRTLDSGTMGGDTGWGFRLVMLLVTLGGIFIVSTLIGILSSGIEAKLDELRKGRSNVLESEHTIILNWSPSIFDIISELVIANESRKRPCIVVMASKDKVEMEDEIAAKAGPLRNTRVVCRSGDPTDLHDIRIVNPQASRSIIILSPEGDDPDSQVIKSIVALVNDPQRRQMAYRIAAEVRDGRNLEIARAVGGNETQLILADELLSRIVVHSSRQSGLSTVYTELLDFDGCEIYTADQPALMGRSFMDAITAYESCCLIGVAGADGSVLVNPSMDRVFSPGDKAILIAEDDGKIVTGGSVPRVSEEAMRTGSPGPKQPERTLILGWNRRGPMIVRELSRYVAPGSELLVVADVPGLEEEVAAIKLAGPALRITYRVDDSAHHDVLGDLDIASYDHVLVLGYSDIMAAQSADTRTLVTLLHLRRLADHAHRHINVVSEMIDVRNRELAEVTRADDFVVSNKLVSLMLAQASENENISAIFGSLLDEEGSEIYMRPAAHYVALGTEVNFHTVAASAAARGEIAIGHCLAAAPGNRSGVTVNPERSARIGYAADDRIIVIARD